MPGHPVAVIGDITAGAAVVASLSGYLHDWVGTIAATMAIVYYIIMLAHWLKNRR